MLCAPKKKTLRFVQLEGRDTEMQFAVSSNCYLVGEKLSKHNTFSISQCKQKRSSCNLLFNKTESIL